MNDRTRLHSVDALRGITVAAMLLVNNAGDWNHIYSPLRHAAWNGATPTDLIFPFFLFLVGVSSALSIVPRVESGQDKSLLMRTVQTRALRIVILGLVLHLLSWWASGADYFRPFGVLQRIGLCFAAVGALAIFTQARTQWLVFAGILLGYWGLMSWGGPFTRDGNLAGRIDTWLLGPLCYQFDPATGIGHEPEGVLSTFPAIATALLGLRAGAWLRKGEVQRLWSVGTYAMLAGFIWAQGLHFPINKQLWTSSYVVWSGGWAMIALGSFHYLMDRRGFPPIGRSLGINAIAIYTGAWLLDCLLEASGLYKSIYAHGFSWMASSYGPYLPSFLYALTFVSIWLVIAKILSIKKVQLKI